MCWHIFFHCFCAVVSLSLRSTTQTLLIAGSVILVLGQSRSAHGEPLHARSSAEQRSHALPCLRVGSSPLSSTRASERSNPMVGVFDHGAKRCMREGENEARSAIGVVVSLRDKSTREVGR